MASTYALLLGTTETLRLPILHLAIALLWQATSVHAVAKVSIVAEGSPLVVNAVDYDARIEPDGCLTNLRIGGRVFLAPGVSISRGSYFFLGGPLMLKKSSACDTIVVASSDEATIRYEFGDNEMTWQLTNKSDDAMVLFIVFAKEVDAAPMRTARPSQLP